MCRKELRVTWYHCLLWAPVILGLWEIMALSVHCLLHFTLWIISLLALCFTLICPNISASGSSIVPPQVSQCWCSLFKFLFLNGRAKLDMFSCQLSRSCHTLGHCEWKAPKKRALQIFNLCVTVCKYGLCDLQCKKCWDSRFKRSRSKTGVGLYVHWQISYNVKTSMKGELY